MAGRIDELLERTAITSAARSLLGRLETGRAAVLMVVGEAGLGKRPYSAGPVTWRSAWEFGSASAAVIRWRPHCRSACWRRS